MAKKLFTDPIKKYQLLFTKAEQFYKRIQAEKEYHTIILSVLGFAFAGELLSFVAWLPSLALELKTWGIVIGFGAIFVSPLLTLFATFIGAGILHLCLMLFKKGLDYFTTWKVVAYAFLIPVVYNIVSSIITTLAESVNPWPMQSLFAPEFLFGAYSITASVFVIVISLASVIHTLYTEVVGLRLYHKITTSQALGALALSLVIVIVIALLFALALSAFLFAVGTFVA